MAGIVCLSEWGLLRYPDCFNDAADEHNAWQLHNMPIKASDCDAWSGPSRPITSNIKSLIYSLSHKATDL